MGRLKELRKYINSELDKMENTDDIISATNHLYGVSLAATILAKKRGLDPEIAAMAGMLHDMHAYKTGSYDDHAHKGADLAREILSELNLTSDEETDAICSAIYHHDDKYAIDAPMDELLKDADDCVIISPSQKSLENTGAWQKCTDFRPKNTVTKCLAGIFEKAALLFLKPNTLIQSLYFRKPVPAF